MLSCMGILVASAPCVARAGFGSAHAHLGANEEGLASASDSTSCSLWMVTPSLVKMEMVLSSAVFLTHMREVGKSLNESADVAV